MGGSGKGGNLNKGAKVKPASGKKTAQSDAGNGMTVNFLTWFEIPALDFQRAVAFYNYLFDIDMETSEVNAYTMAFFPPDKGMSGAIICGEGSIPSDRGPLLYLNASESLDNMLPRVEEMGGRLLLGKTLISESAGHFALFLDSEGNKLAIHEK